MMCTCSLQFELMNTKSAYTCGGAYIQLKLDENILCRKETEVVLDRYVCCAEKKASYTIYIGIVSVKLHEHYINNY